MNEYEKQAIEKFENLLKKHFEETPVSSSDYLDYFESITILNLIEKQQKEIEELSIIKNSIQTLETHFVNDDTYYVIAKKNFLEGNFRHLLDDYISKDKIREKIEELENTYDENNKNDYHNQFIVDCVAILEELLASGQESDQEGG